MIRDYILWDRSKFSIRKKEIEYISETLGINIEILTIYKPIKDHPNCDFILRLIDSETEELLEEHFITEGELYKPSDFFFSNVIERLNEAVFNKILGYIQDYIDRL